MHLLIKSSRFGARSNTVNKPKVLPIIGSSCIVSICLIYFKTVGVLQFIYLAIFVLGTPNLYNSIILSIFSFSIISTPSIIK